MKSLGGYTFNWQDTEPASFSPPGRSDAGCGCGCGCDPDLSGFTMGSLREENSPKNGTKLPICLTCPASNCTNSWPWWLSLTLWMAQSPKKHRSGWCRFWSKLHIWFHFRTFSSSHQSLSSLLSLVLVLSLFRIFMEHLPLPSYHL